MITLVIAILLAAVALPEYTQFIQTQQSVSEINNLLDDFQFARSEALKEGQYVSICVSSTGTSCTVGAWNTGWMVYSNPGFTAAAPNYVAGTSTVLRVQKGLTTSDTLTASPADTVVTYNRDGFAMGVNTTTGQLFTLHNNPVLNAASRCMWLDVLGHQVIEVYNQSNPTGQTGNPCL
jgi:type IV fimbrial biogenesis protein FimT